MPYHCIETSAGGEESNAAARDFLVFGPARGQFPPPANGELLPPLTSSPSANGRRGAETRGITAPTRAPPWGERDWGEERVNSAVPAGTRCQLRGERLTRRENRHFTHIQSAPARKEPSDTRETPAVIHAGG